MEIPKNVQEEIQYYCKINNIEDVDKFLMKILRNGFNIAKYGNGPSSIVIAPKDELEIKHVNLDVKHVITPISLEIPEIIQNVIDSTPKEEEILNAVKIPKELLENKKRDLYDEE